MSVATKKSQKEWLEQFYFTLNALNFEKVTKTSRVVKCTQFNQESIPIGSSEVIRCQGFLGIQTF